MSHRPAFKTGDILRYGSGSTALMRVSTISKNHAGPGHHRYYGQQCMGGSCGAYEDQCTRASAADRRKWFEVRREYRSIPTWRQFQQVRAA